jgi:hypothetical protein
MRRKVVAYRVRADGNPPAATRIIRQQLELQRLVAEIRDNLSSRWLELVQIGAALVALLGLGLYGAIRFGHQVYGNALRIEPEEIGLTYAASVSRAAVVIVALLTVVSFYVFGIWLMTDALNRFHIPWPVRIFLWIIAGAMSIALAHAASELAELGGEGTSAAFEVLSSIWLVMVGLLVAIVVLVFVLRLWMRFVVTPIVHYFRPIRAVKTEADNDKANRIGRQAVEYLQTPLVIVFSLCCVVFGSFFGAGVSARHAADNVQAGYSVRPTRIGLAVLGLHAERVLALGDVADSWELSSKKIMYLGRAEGVAVLYDVEEGRPIRLPADGALLITGTSADVETIGVHRDEMVNLDVPEVHRISSADEMEGNELIWRGKILSLNSAPIRGYLLDKNALVTRSTCEKSKTSLKKLSFPEDLSVGTKMCIFTDVGNWALVEIKEADNKRSRVFIRVVVWNG